MRLIGLAVVLALTLAPFVAEAHDVVPPECADGMSRWRGPEWEARWCGRASPPPRVRVLDSTPGAKYCAMHPSANGGDRKSTRLNSSHSSISYAVFCLKKK